ncbi:MAG: hypothetical protein PHN49_06020 [Candidatus Omnitrophica bacterium]|nr:hypothetical protein [Candidatus Omnitrophota bacterium]
MGLREERDEHLERLWRMKESAKECLEDRRSGLGDQFKIEPLRAAF